MSYYDYDHFWAPHEVCGQRSEQAETKKRSLHLKQFFTQVWDEIFPRKNQHLEIKDNSNIQDRIK